ncbi:FtsX-like permease family protein [Microbacterium sp. 2FI]|uniref:FtsX-like permease family protein n=1 Tax=Microbacterium sp. 2FI TaxID=2502193 RepID=UPI0010F4C742|nr:FtsX-like permease family protein [Microbacterium sp. 2FI]
MTAVLEAHTEAAATAEPADRRPSRSSRWRADIRIARRQTWRAKGSSALVALLVALPVAGLTGAAVFWQSHVPSAEQKVTVELGQNEAWIEIVGGPDPSRWQAVDQPWNSDIDRDETGAPENPEEPAPVGPPETIPAGTTVFEVSPYVTVGVETARGVGWLPTTVGDVWDPAFEGMYVLIDGAAPTAADEMMVSPGALDRLDAQIGDDVVFPDTGRSMMITGTMRSVSAQASVEQLFLPQQSADIAADGAMVRWYTENWQPTLAELEELNHAGYVAYARDLVMDPPADARLSEWGGGETPLWTVLLVGSIAAAICGYIVVLLAGAAFSVAARRQQRALAVAASVGASRRDVFRIVLLQGTVLGMVGGVLGAVVGAAGAALALLITDRGAQGTFWGNFGFQLPWMLVLPILVFAVIVGTLAAAAPARAATKGDTLSALRGARRPALLRPHRPLWGLIVMFTGLGAVVAGVLVIGGTLALGEDGDQQSPLFFTALYAVVLGPLVFQIGALIPSHWLLVQISRILTPLGLAPRIASRDAAATPSRVVPAFAVIGACVFAASFALSSTALTAAQSARQHWYQAPEDALVVGMWQMGSADSAALVDAATDVVAPTSPQATALVSTISWPETDATGQPVDPDAPYFAVARQGYGDCQGECVQPYDAASGNLSIIAVDDIETALGATLSDDVLAALRGGAAVATNRDFLTEDDHVVLTEWTAESYNSLMAWNGTPGEDAAIDPEAEHPLEVAFIDVGHQQPFEIIVTPETAAALGIAYVPSQLIATYAVPLDQGTIDEITAQTQDMRVGADAGLYAQVESGPAPIDPWLWLILGVTVVLVLGASAVVLGLARFERRPDDATLTAVGGSTMLRRNVNAWQAMVIVGIGALLGTASGYLSIWGLAMANPSSFDIADTPWVWLALLGLGLPIGVTLAAWLVPPRHPDLTRRTAIA